MIPDVPRAGGPRSRAGAVAVLAVVVVTGGLVAAGVPSGWPDGVDDALGDTSGGGSSADFPPGTSPDGVENASLLVERHRAALAANGSYRVENGINASRPSGTPRPARWKWNQTVTHRFAVGQPPEFVSNRTVEMPGMRKQMQYYATPDVWHSRIGPGDGDWRTNAQSRDLSATAFRSWALDHSLESSLSRFEFTYAGSAEHGNRTVYRFTSTAYRGERDRGVRYLPNTVTDATATLLVDDRGLVVRLETRYDGTSTAETDAGEEVTVPVSTRYWWSFEPRTDRPVRRPDWVDGASG